MSDIAGLPAPLPANFTSANQRAVPAAQIQAAARDFTAVAYTELLSPIFATVDNSDGPFGGGAGERAFAPMWIAEIAKHMAQEDENGRGMGLTNIVAAQMEKMAQVKKAGKP